MFLAVAIAANKAGLTEVFAKAREMRMSECKHLKRTDAGRLLGRVEPSNAKDGVEEICTLVVGLNPK